MTKLSRSGRGHSSGNNIIVTRRDPCQLSQYKTGTTLKIGRTIATASFVINWRICDDLGELRERGLRATLLGDIGWSIALTATLRLLVAIRGGKNYRLTLLNERGRTGNFLECLLMFYGRNFFNVVNRMTL